MGGMHSTRSGKRCTSANSPDVTPLERNDTLGANITMIEPYFAPNQSTYTRGGHTNLTNTDSTQWSNKTTSTDNVENRRTQEWKRPPSLKSTSRTTSVRRILGEGFHYPFLFISILTRLASIWLGSLEFYQIRFMAILARSFKQLKSTIAN